MRALVTGAAGFIGSHLAGRLITDGHDVVGLDDLSDGTLANLDRAPGMRFVRADLRDGDAVRSAVSGCEVVFHQGAKRSVPRSINEPELFTEVNVRGTLNVLLAARDAGARVVSASSSSVYGDQERFPLVESMPPSPRSPYAASKLAGEALPSLHGLHGRTDDKPSLFQRVWPRTGSRQRVRGRRSAVLPRVSHGHPPHGPRRRKAGP